MSEPRVGRIAAPSQRVRIQLLFCRVYKFFKKKQRAETTKNGIVKLFQKVRNMIKEACMTYTDLYTMVAKSDVQLKNKSYSVCEELFIFILNRK